MRARSAGFCFGVRRALELAEKALKVHGTVCSLGELIHNPGVVNVLRERGVAVIDDLGESRGRPVLIRSHGVAPEVFATAREQGLEIIDATCPFVKRVQEKAADLVRQGYRVVVIGSGEHPEVRGILGWTGYQALVVSDLTTIERLPPCQKLGVLSQTTQDRERFYAVVRELIGKAREVRIYDTICQASLARQQEAIAIASRVSLMVVIGGKNSANTCKLAELCRRHVSTVHIENAAELEPDLFRCIDAVGVTAGASTPDWIIEEVIGGMCMFDEDQETAQVSSQQVPEVPQEVVPQNEAVRKRLLSPQLRWRSRSPQHCRKPSPHRSRNWPEPRSPGRMVRSRHRRSLDKKR
jgi:4-hydroxy-3-methylbut-2-enyl diphosphate reductase